MHSAVAGILEEADLFELRQAKSRQNVEFIEVGIASYFSSRL
jgi:hypothetical protein